mmetsp:Transcript_65831/g.174562  ORF Transcript_65831/g.174562 Transcript_65831/m.174562 type:complete len:207 (+) Transcript_65831:611-1231(+)
MLEVATLQAACCIPSNVHLVPALHGTVRPLTQIREPSGRAEHVTSHKGNHLRIFVKSQTAKERAQIPVLLHARLGFVGSWHTLWHLDFSGPHPVAVHGVPACTPRDVLGVQTVQGKEVNQEAHEVRLAHADRHDVSVVVGFHDIPVDHQDIVQQTPVSQHLPTRQVAPAASASRRVIACCNVETDADVWRLGPDRIVHAIQKQLVT